MPLLSTPASQTAGGIVTRSNTTHITAHIDMQVTGWTPTRNVRNQYDNLRNKASDEISDGEMIIRDRQRLCTGNLICIDSEKNNEINNDHTLGYNNTCAVCGMRRANYFCTGCHHFFHYGKQCPFIITKFEYKLEGLNKSIFSPIDCFSYMHPMRFGDEDFFKNIRIDELKIPKTIRESALPSSSNAARKSTGTGTIKKRSDRNKLSAAESSLMGFALSGKSTNSKQSRNESMKKRLLADDTSPYLSLHNNNKSQLLSLPPPSSLLSPVAQVASNDDKNDSNPSSLCGDRSNNTNKYSQEKKRRR